MLTPHTRWCTHSYRAHLHAASCSGRIHSPFSGRQVWEVGVGEGEVGGRREVAGLGRVAPLPELHPRSVNSKVLGYSSPLPTPPPLPPGPGTLHNEKMPKEGKDREGKCWTLSPILAPI